MNIKNIFGRVLSYMVTKSSGADGIRTRVRTRKQYAFYMLIFALVFELMRSSKYHIINYGVNYHRDLDALTYCISMFEVPPVLSREEMIALSVLAILGELLKISRIHYR